MPEERVQRRLAAILAADVEGYSRLMRADELGTMRTLTSHRAIMDRLITDHGGRIANTAGDSVLAEFPSVVDAVECAVAVQRTLREANDALAEDRRVQFRIGVHVGDVMVRDGDLFGDGVNVASRVETMAEPGGLCISGAAHGYVHKAIPLAYEDLGEQRLKNIDEPVRAFSVSFRAEGGHDPTGYAKVVAAPDKPCVGVLPFNVFGGNPELDALADGIAEDIITELSRVGRLAVLARNSTFIYKGGPVNVKQAARDLGARYIIEGQSSAGRRSSAGDRAAH
jgi:adenylate cyclase